MNKKKKIRWCDKDIAISRRRKMKTIRLSFDCSQGAFKLSAPHWVSQGALLEFLRERKSWMDQCDLNFQYRSKARTAFYLTGDPVPFLDATYSLVVHEGQHNAIDSRGHVLNMILKPECVSCFESKKTLIDQWYRAQMKIILPNKIQFWELAVGAQCTFWGLKKMKTRWGSCNTLRRRIWLNLELASLPELCLDYVIVHELTHILEFNHSPKFWQLVASVFPHWREAEARLKNHQMR